MTASLQQDASRHRVVAAAVLMFGFIESLNFAVRHGTAAWYTEEYPLDWELLSEGLAAFGLLAAGVMLLGQLRAARAVLAVATGLWLYVGVYKVGFIYTIQKQVAKFNTDGAIQWKLILDEALVRGVLGVLLVAALGWLLMQGRRDTSS